MRKQESNGKIGGTLDGVLGTVGSLIGGSLSYKEASKMLTLIDNRSGLQLPAVEGSAKNVDLGAFGCFLAGSVGLGGGGYSNTAEGKVLIADFTDSFNNMGYSTQVLQSPRRQRWSRHWWHIESKLSYLPSEPLHQKSTYRKSGWCFFSY